MTKKLPLEIRAILQELKIAKDAGILNSEHMKAIAFMYGQENLRLALIAANGKY